MRSQQLKLIWMTNLHARGCFECRKSSRGMISEMKLDASLGLIMKAVREINVYLQERAPWTAAKNGDLDGAKVTLKNAAECLRICSALLFPVMPEKMAELRSALGMEDVVPEMTNLAAFDGLKAGSKISQPGALFPRIEVKAEESPKAEKPSKAEKKADKSAKTEKKDEVLPEGVISFDQVMAVNLKTAKILEAEKVEGTDKLMKLQLEVGEERRQIVAGIALHYKAEELPGKTIVIVANLKPAKLRGIESQGMLLAASIGDKLTLITTDSDLPTTGANVK